MGVQIIFLLSFLFISRESTIFASAKTKIGIFLLEKILFYKGRNGSVGRAIHS